MIKIGDISRSLNDQVKSIKKALFMIDKAKRDRISYQKSADSYYQSYRHARRGDYYYKKYQQYSGLADRAAKEVRSKTLLTRGMIESFKESMIRFKTLAKGRDKSIIELKRKVAEQEVIFVQSTEANTLNEKNVIATYAKSNFALLNGIIEAVKKAVPKDEMMLLRALKNVNRDALAHTERMISSSDNAIRVLIAASEAATIREGFKDSSLISSASTVVDAKLAEMGSALSGESDNIVDTALQFIASGIVIEKISFMLGNFFSPEGKRHAKQRN